MERAALLILLHLVYTCRGEIIPVRILAEEHVNLVSEKFLSFSVDPKYLFEKEKTGRECICMASALSPSMIRIAGPSTSLMGFTNSSITLNSSAEHQANLTINIDDWKKFAEWARNNNVTVVFALNNAVKTKAGLWDPHTALDILTAAQQADLKDIVWQLGYECQNSSLEEYLKDLETLKVMVDTLPFMRWKVVAGDVSGCLDGDSKTDFADYIRISTERMDALFLNGNSTSAELNKLPPPEHQKILDTVSNSSTQLWITERKDAVTGIERAAEWLAHLGYSAKGGFDINFWELGENEIFQPTVSFYMSLLYKNVVGGRVLDVNMPATSSEACLFAHCTSLKQEPVSGAVTLFGANMDLQPVRFAVKFSQREEGGDIMQFVLTQDRRGNVLVNGFPLQHEGDIRPVVKRVRPYKTLLLTLPARSIGFWVLANANIEACVHTNEVKPVVFVPATNIEDVKEKMIINKTDVTRNKREIINNVRNKVNEISDNIKNKGTKVGEFLHRELFSISDQMKYLKNALFKIKKSIEPVSRIVKTIKNSSENFIHERFRRQVANKIKEMTLKLTNNTFSATTVKPQIPKLSSLSVKTKEISTPKTEKTNVESEMPKTISSHRLSPTPPKLRKIEEIEKIEKPRTKLIELRSRLKLRHLKLFDRLKNKIHRKNHIQNEATVIEGDDKKHHTRIENYLNNRKHKRHSHKHLLLRHKRSAEEDNDSRISPNESKENLGKKNYIGQSDVIMKMIQQLKDAIKMVPKVEVNEDMEEDLEKRKKKNDVRNTMGENDISGEYDDTIEDQVVINTKISNDDTSISVNEKSNTEGFMKKAFSGVSHILNELNDKINNLFTLMNVID